MTASAANPETRSLTDRAALARNRARAVSEELFLHDVAAEDVQDRLGMVNREFKDAALITGQPAHWERLADGFTPRPRVVEAQEVLPLEPQSLDLVLHMLDLHWAEDPVGQLIQCRRALRPDGLLLAVLFGGQTLTELRAALGQAEVEVTGGLSPRIAPMGEVRDLGSLLQRAGFALPVAESFTQRVTFRDPLHLMRTLRLMGEGNALAERLRRPTRREVMLRAVQHYLDTYGEADGRVPASFEFITLTAWAPDESQQKPLRPGSAAARLADALGSDEIKLPE